MAYRFKFGFNFPGGGAAMSPTTPGGSDQSIQFNDNGAFGGAADFIYDKTDSTLQFAAQNDNAGFLFNPSNGAGNQGVTVQGDLEGGSGAQAELILEIDDGMKTNQIFISPSGISISADEGNVLLQTADATGLVTANAPLGVRLKANGDIIVEVSNDGVHDKLGFFAATPIQKPTVTGAKLPADTVMANLLTALKNLGLITDSTT